MVKLLLLGQGYTASRLAGFARAQGWQVIGTSRDGRTGTLRLDDAALASAMADSSHILSSIPPGADGSDPALPLLRAHTRPGQWLGYLSSTGVYPDTRGGWIDEQADAGFGHRTARAIAEQAWREAGWPVHIFRLPGIYGPGGRSALDRVRQGNAHRIDLAASGVEGHVFCRIHVDDIVATLVAAMQRPPRGTDIWNVTDDLPASGNAVIEHAAALLGLPAPPMVRLDDPSLSAMARSFYAACRRVHNGKIKRELGVRLRYPTYVAGLAACLKEDGR